MARQRGYDSDLWVIEIETDKPETVLDAPVL
ncbi:MAG: DUF1491 family protein [Stellaceae bacterium]